MYEILQVVAKLIIIIAITLVALYSALRVWRMDLDLRRLLNPATFVTKSAEERVA